MPGDDRMIEGHRGTEDRPQDRNAASLTRERQWLNTNPRGRISFVPETSAWLFWNFDINRSELKDEHNRTIEGRRFPRFLTWLRDAINLGRSIHIRGFASESGIDSWNDTLADDRARNLLLKLISTGELRPEYPAYIHAPLRPHGSLDEHSHLMFEQTGRRHTTVYGEKMALNRSVAISRELECDQFISRNQVIETVNDYVRTAWGFPHGDYTMIYRPLRETLRKLLPDNISGQTLIPDPLPCNGNLGNGRRVIDSISNVQGGYVSLGEIIRISYPYCNTSEIQAVVDNFIRRAKRDYLDIYAGNSSEFERLKEAIASGNPFVTRRGLILYTTLMDCLESDSLNAIHYISR